MKIVNVGIYVKDIEEVKFFFEHYFEAKVHAVLDDEENSYYSYILSLGEGAFIELMNKPSIVDEAKDPNRTGFAHINIQVDSRETYSPGGAGEIRAVTIEDLILEVSCE